jgi:hypothetical protein
VYTADFSTLKGLQVLIETCLFLNLCIQIFVIHEDSINICHTCLHCQNVIYPKVTYFIYYYVYSCSICSLTFFLSDAVLKAVVMLKSLGLPFDIFNIIHHILKVLCDVI